MRIRTLLACGGVVALTAASMLTVPVRAQDAVSDLPAAETILNDCIEAMGGEAAFKSIKSSRILATAELMGMGELTVEILSAEDGKFFAKQSLEGMGEFSSGSDGKVVWGTDQMTGELAVLEGDDADQARSMSSIATAVLEMKKDLKSAETLEKTEFNGATCYKVKAVDKDDTETTAYFDTSTKLLAGTEQEQENPMMGTVLVVMNFLDYKKVDPITTYSRILVDQAGMEIELKFKEIEFNKVDASRFELPEKVKELLAEAADQDDDEDGDDDGDDDAGDEDDDDGN